MLFIGHSKNETQPVCAHACYFRTLSDMSYPYPEAASYRLRFHERVVQPFDYMSGAGGSRVRDIVIQALNWWAGASPEHCERVAKFVDTLHVASLLVDDVEDDSPLRRGIPTAHTKFGIGATVHCLSVLLPPGIKSQFV
ncbi:MAG: hypothetical protein MHM6MM_008721 [Cercozoa sp. M6MM]